MYNRLGGAGLEINDDFNGIDFARCDSNLEITCVIVGIPPRHGITVYMILFREIFRENDLDDNNFVISGGESKDAFAAYRCEAPV